MAPAIENLCDHVSRLEHAGFGAVLPKCARHGAAVLGMELLYGGEQTSFSSLRANDSESALLNLEQGDPVSRWGRLIFYVTDVDAFWTHLKERGVNPEIPRDASWGERYPHMLDPDGHELSFAQPLQ
jgi:uncharacterized glyoxalase superfamily protein PhnB